jgi:hypothetical protein
MKYLKTFESFSPINEEEEGLFGSIKKFIQGDVVQDALDRMPAQLLFPGLDINNEKTHPSKQEMEKRFSEIAKKIELVKSEKDINKKNEILKEIFGDWEDPKHRDTLIRLGIPYNRVRAELGCMTPEEKEEWEDMVASHHGTGWEGSTGISL